MIHGRAAERAAISARLDLAQDGRGGALVLRGEPGIGKSALLAEAALLAETGRVAADVLVLRTACVEPEHELAYATLHGLLHPLLAGLDTVPEAQAGALRTIFGLAVGPPPDRFLVAQATLTLLTDAASDRPVLCLVDDVHWADESSAAVLGVVSRRLSAEPVLILFASRGGGGTAALAGVAELPLVGLDPDAAQALLAEASGGRLSGRAQDVVLRTAAGNPLALRELPAALPPDGPTGEPLPLVERLQEAFLRRVRTLHPPARRLLLLLATDGTGRSAVLRRAAAAHGDAAHGDEVGELERLLDDLPDLIMTDAGSVAFRHPLVRSAVYHAAVPSERRAAHSALARALAADPAEFDRAAWHRGHSTDEPDPDVAAQLDGAAERTAGRAGPAAAVSLLVRAAALTPPGPEQARRLVAAAAASWHGGDPAGARARLDAAELADPPAAVGHDVLVLRALVELRAGSPGDALRLLRPVLADALPAAPAAALDLIMLVGEAGYHADDPGAWSATAAALHRLPEPDGSPAGVLLRLARTHAQVRAGEPVVVRPEHLAAIELLTDPRYLCWAGGMVTGLGDHERGRWLRRTALRRARVLGAAGTLAWVLGFVVNDDVMDGRFREAESYAEEGLRHAEETGQPNLSCSFRATLAVIAAVRGRSEQATELADQVMVDAAERGLAAAAATAHRALGLVELSAGRSERALRHFRPRDDVSHPGIALQCVPDLVEAACRIDRPDLAAEPLRQYEGWAQASGAPDMLALVARCRALTDDAVADEQFPLALTLHAAAERPVDLARTQVLYGEYLRRTRRRAAAREPLRAAVTAFDALDATVWADRARRELRATGESPAEAVPDALAALTPQELQVATAVAGGATNREIAAQLFLSTRTIDYHLRKIFHKAGVTSRTELARLTMSAGAPGT